MFSYTTVSPSPGEASSRTAADDANTLTAGGFDRKECLPLQWIYRD